MAVFKGAGVAIVTPFTQNNEVNYEKLGELIDYQIAAGTDSIIICGTTGEASTLTHEEHLECIRYAVNKVAKRVPVIAGTGSNSTDTAIFLSQEAQKHGADALLVVTPYYNKATQKGLIARRIDLPECGPEARDSGPNPGCATPRKSPVYRRPDASHRRPGS